MDKSKSTPEIPECGFFTLLIIYAAVATVAVVCLVWILPEFWLLWAFSVLFLPMIVNKVLRKELLPDPADALKVRIVLLVSVFFSAAVTILYLSGNENGFCFTARLALWCFNTILCRVACCNFTIQNRWKIPVIGLYLTQFSIGAYHIINDIIWYWL